MKIPKKTRRFCPFCKKHTEHKIVILSSGHQRGAQKRGSIQRAIKRGLGKGMGNVGKWGSKPAVTSFKRKVKSTKKTNLMYTCNECKKSKIQRKGDRVGKVVYAQETK